MRRRSGGGSSSRGSDTGCVVENGKGIISYQDISCVMAWYARCLYRDNVKRRSGVGGEFEVEVVLERMDGLRERCGGVVAWCALSEHGGSEHGGSKREGVSECKREESTQPHLPPPTTHHPLPTHLRIYLSHTHPPHHGSPPSPRPGVHLSTGEYEAPLRSYSWRGVARRGVAWRGVAWRGGTQTQIQIQIHTDTRRRWMRDRSRDR
jgi:hypothetical protein